MKEAKSPPHPRQADLVIDLADIPSSGTLVSRLYAEERAAKAEGKALIVDLFNFETLLGNLSREREFQLYSAIAKTALTIRFPDLEDFDQDGIRKMQKMLMVRRTLGNRTQANPQARYQLPEDDGFAFKIKSNRAALKRKQRAELHEDVKRLRDKVVALKLIGYKETEIERYFQKRDASGNPVANSNQSAKMPNTGVEIKQASINKLFKAYKDYNERIYSGGSKAGAGEAIMTNEQEVSLSLIDIHQSSGRRSKYFVKSKRTKIELAMNGEPFAPFFLSFTQVDETVPTEILYVQPHQLNVMRNGKHDQYSLSLDIINDDTVLTIGKYLVRAFFDPLAVEETTHGKFECIIGQEFVSIRGISPIQNRMASDQQEDDNADYKVALNYLITDYEKVIDDLKIDPADIVQVGQFYQEID